ncbi:winged helix-turn-helix transcriptional regulator [Patulibacter americanus]|uniref:winged helix-turn-helix transcriptional regulator n=1 Tax=Patulibacter americanus TaxID=588672 RepID=UPI0004098FDF|nr:helix-turn-helix domain-containing protein [Patulibacter americanus]
MSTSPESAVEPESAEVAGDVPVGGAEQAFVVDVFARGCTSRTVLQHVTGRWGVLALVGLAAGPVRFNALRRRIDGVSEKMLAQTLQALERDGFVLRDVQASIPPRVEYRLTPLGERTAERLGGLVELLEDSMGEVEAAQAAYDAGRGGA